MNRFFFFDARLCPTVEEIRYVLGQQDEVSQSHRFEDDCNGRKCNALLMGTREEEQEQKKLTARSRTAEEMRKFLEGFDTKTLWNMAIQYSLSEVAALLNVSSTRLKEFCRERGIPQWPRRFAMSLESIIEFHCTREKEKTLLETLYSESFHNRFEFEGEAKAVFEKCKKRMYRIRHKQKNATNVMSCQD